MLEGELGRLDERGIRIGVCYRDELIEAVIERERVRI
jgi:hypothetical protein